MKIIYIIFMSLSVFILSSVLCVKQNTNIIFGDTSDLYTVNISVEKSQTPEKVEVILKQIQDIHPQQIKKVTLISSQELVADIEKVLPSYSSGLFENEELEQILSPIVEVQLAPEANSSELIEKIKVIPGISNVTFSVDWIEKFRSLFSVANIILDTVFVLFFVILSFLIAVLIRNYLISTKDSILLYSLLGATPRQAFIKPYTQIIISTLISYAVGIAFTFALTLTVKQKISNNTDFAFINNRVSFLNNTNISIVALGLLLNVAISYWLSYHYINKEYYKHD
jgi:cell division protein FtsX